MTAPKTCMVTRVDAWGRSTLCGQAAHETRTIRGVTFDVCASCIAAPENAINPTPEDLRSAGRRCGLFVVDANGNTGPCGEPATTRRTTQGVTFDVCDRCAASLDTAELPAGTGKMSVEPSGAAHPDEAWEGALTGIAEWLGMPVDEVAKLAGPKPDDSNGKGGAS